MKTRVIFSLLALALISCTKEIQLDVPILPPKLTLDAKISVGDSITVFVGTSSSILDEQHPGADNLSRVYLYKNDVLIDSLTPRLYPVFVPGAFYRYHSGHIAEAGHQYKLAAEREGFETASGQDHSPAAVQIENLKIDKLAKSLSFTLTDDPATDDYYMIELYREDQAARGGIASLHHLASYDPTVMMLYSTGTLEDGGSTGRRAIWHDANFKGLKKHVEVFYDSTLTSDLEYTLKVSRISGNYFLFENSRSVQYSSGLQIIGDRANLYSNVTNGYGAVICQNPIRYKFSP